MKKRYSEEQIVKILDEGERGEMQRHMIVEADLRPAWIVGPGVDIQNVFHAPDKVGTYGWNAPLLPHSKRKPLFFTSCRTVSCEMRSTTFSSTNRSAKSCNVHRFRPSGGLLWARVSRTASPFSSSFFCRPSRGRSLRAPSRAAFR